MKLINKLGKPKSPSATPIKTLAKEMMFSYIQSKVGCRKLAKIMVLANKKGLIKNQRDFRAWMVDEVCKTVDIIERWLDAPQS